MSDTFIEADKRCLVIVRRASLGRVQPAQPVKLGIDGVAVVPNLGPKGDASHAKALNLCLWKGKILCGLGEGQKSRLDATVFCRVARGLRAVVEGLHG